MSWNCLPWSAQLEWYSVVVVVCWSPLVLKCCCSFVSFFLIFLHGFCFVVQVYSSGCGGGKEESRADTAVGTAHPVLHHYSLFAGQVDSEIQPHPPPPWTECRAIKRLSFLKAGIGQKIALHSLPSARSIYLSNFCLPIALNSSFSKFSSNL